MADYKLFINGEYTDGGAGETFATSDPGTNQVIGGRSPRGARTTPSGPSRPPARRSTKARGRARAVPSGPEKLARHRAHRGNAEKPPR